MLFFPTVIEVSCGEYGDHVGNLVKAIGNGKHDIREGKPFPLVKENNLQAASQHAIYNGNGKYHYDEAAVPINGGINNTFAFAAKYLAKDSNGKIYLNLKTPQKLTLPAQYT
jgi:hypothetical protein